jgi:hypothetical protein
MYNKKLVKEGTLLAAKKIKEDPSGAVNNSAKQRQVYCVSKRRHNVVATDEEMNRVLVLHHGQDAKDKEDVHHIIQCRLR